MNTFKHYLFMAIIFTTGGFAGAATVHSMPAMLLILIIGLVILAIVAYKVAPSTPTQKAMERALHDYDAAYRIANADVPPYYIVTADDDVMVATHSIGHANDQYNWFIKQFPQARLALQHAGYILRKNYEEM